MNDTHYILGRKPATTKPVRDAVHVPIMIAISAEELRPGQRVGIVPGTANGASAAPHIRKLGIVDPWREGVIPAGEPFYLCCFPGSICSMRHHWQHVNAPESEIIDE